jgi:hypothetical protein
MLYMSGGGVQVFSIGIVAMLLFSPFKNLANINSAFAPFAPAEPVKGNVRPLVLHKLAYFGCNLLTLALGLYKCRSMGLLPTGTGDWLAFETRGMVSADSNNRNDNNERCAHASFRHPKFCFHSCVLYIPHCIFTLLA